MVWTSLHVGLLQQLGVWFKIILELLLLLLMGASWLNLVAVVQPVRMIGIGWPAEWRGACDDSSVTKSDIFKWTHHWGKCHYDIKTDFCKRAFWNQIFCTEINKALIFEVISECIGQYAVFSLFIWLFILFNWTLWAFIIIPLFPHKFIPLKSNMEDRSRGAVQLNI